MSSVTVRPISIVKIAKVVFLASDWFINGARHVKEVIALVDDDQKMVVRRTMTEIMVVQVKIKEFRGCNSWMTETSLWVTLSFGKLDPFIYLFQELLVFRILFKVRRKRGDF